MMSEAELERLYQTHGCMAALSWSVVFPLGAIMIRLAPSKRAWIIHAGIMLIGLMMMTAAFGIGVNRVPTINNETIGSAAHYIIGTTVFSVAWAQPFLGYLHHHYYKIDGQRSFMSVVHVFFGRLLMFVGIINGGVGLLKAGYSTRAENIAYGVVVACIWIAYIFTSLWYDYLRFKGVTEQALREIASNSDIERTSEGDVSTKA